MIKFLTFYITIILLIPMKVFAQSSTNENNYGRNTIECIGNSFTEVIADEAVFTFSVIGFAESLSSAINIAREKVDAISKEIFKIGLRKQNLTTSKFNSSENYGDKSFLSSSKDFRALIIVEVRVDSLNFLEPLISTISLMNPDDISQITFRLKDIESIRLSAIENAILNSKDKANVMCNKLNIKLGAPIYIEEIQKKDNEMNNNVVRLFSGVVNESVVQISSFFIEKIKVESSVKVIFDIIKTN